MVFSCVVPFRRKKKKNPDLSLPPCRCTVDKGYAYLKSGLAKTFKYYKIPVDFVFDDVNLFSFLISTRYNALLVSSCFLLCFTCRIDVSSVRHFFKVRFCTTACVN